MINLREPFERAVRNLQNEARQSHIETSPGVFTLNPDKKPRDNPKIEAFALDVIKRIRMNLNK